MISRDDIVEAVNLICDKLFEMILELADDSDADMLEDMMYFESVTVHTYLSHFQAMILVGRICKDFKLNIERLLNNECDNLPLRYLACYILLNGDNEKEEE